MKTLLDREDLIFDPPESGCVLSLTGLPGGDGKIYDRSPYANIGTIIGATWVMLPTGLWCLGFDGTDDSVSCGNQASLSVSEVTLGMWINPVTVSTDWERVWQYRVDGNNRCSLHFKDSKVGFYEYDSPLSVDIYPDSTVTTGTWIYVVLVIDATNGRLYVNGVLQADTEATTVPFSTLGVGTLYLGSDNAPGNFYEGQMALTRLYSRALSALEIQNHFSREKHLFGVW